MAKAWTIAEIDDELRAWTLDLHDPADRRNREVAAHMVDLWLDKRLEVARGVPA